MSLGPLLSVPPPIPWHAFAAFTALVLGGARLALPKGAPSGGGLRLGGADACHRRQQFLYLADSSLWPFSPIHLLSILVRVTVPLAVWHAHNHRVTKHRKAMIALYVFALVGAGVFTLLLDQIMHAVVFGQ